MSNEGEAEMRNSMMRVPGPEIHRLVILLILGAVLGLLPGPSSGQEFRAGNEATAGPPASSPVTCPVKRVSLRDPFRMELPQVVEIPEESEVEPVVLSGLLDLSKIKVVGYMRMLDGERMAVVDITPAGPMVVRTGQPLLLATLDGSNILCLVKKIDDHLITLELTDGQEVTLPVAGAAGKAKAVQVKAEGPASRGKGRLH